ncbi:WhiB family transcriptional regulator [Streptomyces sp. NPDC058251]|uniref:WhiB family transcriptional regulator n=1 Tax=unclassified Streptomyces TaxID=2593676 RepID=UPI0036E8E6AA
MRTARDLCASCPLWAECLQDAVTHTEPPGYTAATTADDRNWMRRALGLGDENGDLPDREAERDRPEELVAERRRGTVSRRLARVRSRVTGSASRWTDGYGAELALVLDAFDARQEQLAQQERFLQDAPPYTVAARASSQESLQSQIPPARRVPVDSRNEEPMAAAEAGQRIAFSLKDPAQAIQRVVLVPLIRSAVPALTSVEQLTAMLTTVPGGGVTHETVTDIRRVREAVESMLPQEPDAADGEDGPGSQDTADRAAVPLTPFRSLTGSVCVELALSDPVAALRRDFLEPLMRDLVASLSNIEKVATMLAATTGEEAGQADDPRLETIRAALRGLTSRLPQRATHPATAGAASARLAASTGNTADAGPGRRSSTPSIRAAVEQSVATLPGPFAARDVLRSLPPGMYGDPSKTISNVLSALVKSGLLRRLSRGTYVRARDLDLSHEPVKSA